MENTPAFYHPEKVGTLYVPATADAITAGAAADLTPAADDRRRVILLLVDPQVDFIHEEGSLAVPGAVDDTRRTVEWLYRHAHEITAIAASLDSHSPTQIFYPTWWEDDEGQHPAPFTPISAREVEEGRWRPVYEPAWSVSYVNMLGTQAKKELMIWPYHTMLGTPGHSVTPALYEAIAYHAAARESQPTFLTKGSLPKTEHYSLLEPEVKVPGEPQGELNVPFLEMLSTYDVVYVAGQAKSHCVLETVASVVRYFENRPDELAKWRILSDCMSSVPHPTIDFDGLADEALARYAHQGIGLRQSVDAID
jgi:nicotinamidase/pyrazinamidase